MVPKWALHVEINIKWDPLRRLQHNWKIIVPFVSKDVINLDCGTAVAVSDILESKKVPFWAVLQRIVFIYPLLKHLFKKI